MNKNSHRVIFNAARGQRMVVAECASSGGGRASGETPTTADTAFAPLAQPLTLSVALALTLGLVFHSTANAQIVADPGAPAHQRPTILQAGTNLSSGHLQLAGRALDVSNSQTRAKTLSLDATAQIDAAGADLFALAQVNIAGKTLITTDAQLQALGDIQIVAEQLDNRAGLIVSGGRLRVASDEIDNRDTRTTSTSAGAAPRGLIAQSVDLNAATLLNQEGAVIAENDLHIASAGRIDNTLGLLSAGGALDIREPSGGTAPAISPRTLNITNTGGTLIADEQLAVAAKSLSLDGDLLSQQDMALSLQGDHANAQGARIVANRDLVGGTYGAASAATVDANNRQLHPTEAKLIKENARRFAKKLYGTDQPSGEQIEAAQAMLTNTAQNAVDNNWGFDVPYFEEADAFLQQLKVEYRLQNGTLALPGTSGQPGGTQQLFYADGEQKNQAWINQGLADPAITGLIVRTPIKPQTHPDALDPSRDRLTGLPLDDKGRYTVRVDLGNPFDGYETYTPKYFPCATAECVRGGQNLDMSDPETKAYVNALDAQIFKDIGAGATIASLATPIGASGNALMVLGLLASGGEVMTSETPSEQALDEGLKFLGAKGAEVVFKDFLGHSPSVAARAVALIDLMGGWDAFAAKFKRDVLGKN